MAGFLFRTNALGKHYWILRDGNNETIADAQQGDGYENERDAKHGADVFTNLGHDAPRREISEGTSTGANPEFEYFESARNKQWYWRFRAKNGRVVADGSEGYGSRSNVTRAIDNVQTELTKLRDVGGSETPPSDSPYA
ncbi:DUF1508 domain-containing protein [Rubricoccus marinus]|uniref:DUF1508 domain-containing protein n=1 Tax=Rubricoccus marinus TaxID=716817 RepID=A0A259TUN2_9BACT|nr:YegP family protein [Rubricoccus marinus]OZC01453.1 hypothetical protein BSZ36_17400 [Rubricoccus marinus]